MSKMEDITLMPVLELFVNFLLLIFKANFLTAEIVKV